MFDTSHCMAEGRVGSFEQFCFCFCFFFPPLTKCCLMTKQNVYTFYIKNCPIPINLGRQRLEYDSFLAIGRCENASNCILFFFSVYVLLFELCIGFFFGFCFVFLLVFILALPIECLLFVCSLLYVALYF